MIRQGLFIHNVVRRPYRSDDFMGDAWGPAQEIRGVRVEPAVQVRGSDRGVNMAYLSYRALLFAPPDAAKWQEKDKVIFNGLEMTVQSVAYMYGATADVHHVEVQLI
ncbi:putative minor capsid protein [Peptococcus niger]|uniref:Minor capsid protein n=1 Tax=Peptococcus niger TaxID=2741 RepID=A0A1G6RNR6_PEPNI|nr:putative minor capsid protein [Peptococcus niger]SDD06312.1 Minor capsid protein [Peptococcus niger]